MEKRLVNSHDMDDCDRFEILGNYYDEAESCPELYVCLRSAFGGDI